MEIQKQKNHEIPQNRQKSFHQKQSEIYSSDETKQHCCF